VVSGLWGNHAGAGEALRSSAPPTSRKSSVGSTLDLFRDAPADARGLFDGGKV
jgi:hypothetical protein